MFLFFVPSVIMLSLFSLSSFVTTF